MATLVQWLEHRPVEPETGVRFSHVAHYSEFDSHRLTLYRKGKGANRCMMQILGLGTDYKS